ncbi:hypothetical protein Anas_05533 [Armadillidium nasatum]|uniref:Uncharacterized protein n=1 Tax=Armadillidium nasatum TaxID=96803 RepID=A0A5N5T7U2_9CRUS|nr:hypothetical protein Anas_05533 [Armadillidium nasatum]
MTSIFKLIFSLILFNEAFCQNQIFFPRESPIIEHTTEDLEYVGSWFNPGSLVIKEPHGSNREIVFPNVTPQDLDNSAQNSIIKFEQRIVNRNIIAPPNTPVFWHSRLFETTNEIFKKGQDATLVLETSKDLMKSFNLNKEQAEIGLPNFNVLGTVIKDTCPPGPRCPDPGFAYRTMDGSCNNIEQYRLG